MAQTDVLYKVVVDTAGSDAALESLKNSTDKLAQNAALKITADSTQAVESLDQLKVAKDKIGTGSNAIKINADTTGALAGVKSITSSIKELDSTKAGGQAFDGIKSSVAGAVGELGKFESAEKQAMSTKSIKEHESALGGLKEKLGGIAGTLGGGLIAGGAALGLEKVVEAGKARLESEEKLKIAVSATGGTQDQVNAKFKQASALTDSLASEFAKPKDQVRELVGMVSGIGGLSGEQAKKVGEIGVAFQQLGISGRALKGVLLGANDPDSQAALEALKKQFPLLSSAMAGATTTGEKMDAIYKTVGPTLSGMKEAAEGPLGQMNKMEEAGKDLEAGFGKLVVSALTPFIGILSTTADILNSTVVPVLSATTGFINDNKTAVMILVGAYVAFRAAMAIKEAGGFAATLTKLSSGAIDFGKNLLSKVVPGLFASTAAQEAQTLATGTTTTAQTGLNAALLANPIGLVVGAIGLLVAGFVLAYNNIKPVHEWVDKLWGNFKIFIAGIKGAIMPAIQGLSEAFGGVGKVIDGIIHLDFNKIATGTVQALKGVTDAYKGAKDGMVKGIVEESASLDKQKQAAKDAGDAGVAGAKAAAQAQGDLRKATDDANASSKDQFDQSRKQLDSFEDSYNRQQEYIKSGTANGIKLTQDQIAAYKESNKELLIAGKTRAKQLDEYNAKAGSNKKLFEGDDSKSTKPKHHKDEDLLAISEKKAVASAKDLELELKLQDAQAGIAFSSRDELRVQQLKSDVLQKELLAKDILNKPKYADQAQFDLKQDKLATLTLTAKVKVDDDQAKKEVERAAKAQVDTLHNLQQQNAADELTLDKSVIDQRIANGELFGNAAIDAQADLSQREEALEQSKLDEMLGKDMEYFKTKASMGATLTAVEQATKSALEKKYQDATQALKLKYAKDTIQKETDLQKTASEAVLSIYKKLQQSKAGLSNEEIADKKLGFDKEQTALVASLQKGEISQREYQVKLALLSKNRTDFQQKNEQNNQSQLVKATKDTLSNLFDQNEKYFEGLAQRYLNDVLFNQSAQNSKAVATATGNAAAVASNATAATSNVALAGSSMLSAQAGETAGSVLQLGPVAGPIFAVAENLAMMELFKGVKSVLGFEKGGIGMIGEKGPEVISPMKDMSHLVTQLVRQTAQATKEALTGDQKQGRSRVSVNVKGRLITSGRDLQTSLQRDAISRRTEQFA